MQHHTEQQRTIEFPRHAAWRTWMVLLMCILAYWVWAGSYTLAPGHIGWLMRGMDTPSQYLGWQFFRHAPWWQWPVGANAAYGSDAPGSIVLSDSIPLMALLFKALSPWLPWKFQYFGIWECICFLLQGWFALRLMRRITSDAVAQVAGVVFFLTASIFLVRVYMHPALSAQWLLLAAFDLAMDLRFRHRRWVILLCMAVLIHAYLFVMVAAIWTADLVQRLWRRECVHLRVAAHALVAVIAVAVLMAAIGYFSAHALTPAKLISYLDLSFPFWTSIPRVGEWSWVVPSSQIEWLAFDGFGYFGLGYLGLCLLVICGLVVRMRQHAPQAYGDLPPPSTWVVLGVVCSVLFVYALNGRIVFSGHILFSMHMPGWLERIYATFRGAARTMWPIWYLLMLGCLLLVLRLLPLRWARIALVFAAVLQLADLSRAAFNERRSIAGNHRWQSTMTSPSWDKIASRYRHLVFLQPASVPAEMVTFVSGYKSTADFAARHGMTINVAYLAREQDQRIAVARQQRVKILLAGQSEPDTFYVVADDSLWTRLLCAPRSAQSFGTLDGLRLMLPAGSRSFGEAARSPVGCTPR